MGTWSLTPFEELTAEIRDLALKILTTDPANLPPTEAMHAAAAYVQTSHLLEHHRENPDANPAEIARAIASGDQTIAAMRDRVAELEQQRAAREDATR